MTPFDSHLSLSCLSLPIHLSSSTVCLPSSSTSHHFMFTTFARTPSESAGRGKANGKGKGRQNGASPPDAPHNNTPPRSKRSQVARACDLCRLHRAKCDNNQPCSNCQHRGERCSNSGTSDIRTMPAALRCAPCPSAAASPLLILIDCLLLERYSG